jgi:hypothetical protein
LTEQVFWHKGNGHSYKQTDFPLLDLKEIPGPDFFRLVAEVNKGLLYLASPYRSNWRVTPVQALRRKERVIDLTERLLNAGVWVFSPITYGAAIEDRGHEHDNQWWLRIDFEFFKHCDLLAVYCLKGWEDSLGVNKEIDWALSTNKSVLLIEE